MSLTSEVQEVVIPEVDKVMAAVFEDVVKRNRRLTLVSRALQLKLFAACENDDERDQLMVYLWSKAVPVGLIICKLKNRSCESHRLAFALARHHAPGATTALFFTS